MVRALHRPRAPRELTGGEELCFCPARAEALWRGVGGYRDIHWQRRQCLNLRDCCAAPDAGAMASAAAEGGFVARWREFDAPEQAAGGSRMSPTGVLRVDL